MSIRDFMPDSTFSREYAYNLILFFLNKKLVAYLDKVKAYELLVKQKAIITPEDIPEKRPPKVTIREIMDEITRSLIPSFHMPKDEKNLGNIRREITDYVTTLVENPGSHRLLKVNENRVLKVPRRNASKPNRYHLKFPLTEITPEDQSVYYQKFQLYTHLLDHIVGIDDVIDGEQKSISKLEKMHGSTVLGELGDYSEKNPILILKTGGFPAKLNAPKCQNLITLIKTALKENLQIKFDYKTRDEDVEKPYEIEPVGIDLNISNGTIWLIAGGKKKDDKGKLLPTPAHYAYRLEKINNPKLGTKKLVLTEEERSTIRKFISDDLEGNYIRSKVEILTAQILIKKSFNDYVIYTPWFFHQKFMEKQGENYVYQVEAVKETIFSKVHAARGVATIIHPPELVEEFLKECDSIKEKHESAIAEVKSASKKSPTTKKKT